MVRVHGDPKIYLYAQGVPLSSSYSVDTTQLNNTIAGGYNQLNHVH